MRLVPTLACCLVFSAAVAAQWPPHLRPDVPKTTAGAPDPSAPAPRLPGGTPDLSGVWESRIPPSGRLELDVTVEDPKAYTRPWTVRINYRLVPDQQLIEFVCNENEQSSKHYLTK